jgi:hypothetical protein
MNKRDYIGERGEALFQVMITNWCGEDEPWFQAVHLGEKYPAKDFLVDLVNPASGQAHFYVQVKATRGKYTGKGRKRKLKVGVSKTGMKALKKVPAPVFVVGIDIETGNGYVVQVTQGTGNTLPSIPLTHPLDCARIKEMWDWVDDYWLNKTMLPKQSAFT